MTGFFPHKCLPFLSMSIALYLSWSVILLFTLKPWLPRNRNFQRTQGIWSSTPIISDSVEIIELILCLLLFAGHRTFTKQNHTPVMSLQIRMHAVCIIDPPSNGIYWILLQCQLHTSRLPAVTYCTGELLVIVLVSIADSCGKEIQLRLEVWPWLASEEYYLCHKSLEQVGLHMCQRSAIFLHCEQIIGCLGLGDTVHLLHHCLQDTFDVIRHSYTSFVLCAIIKPHNEVVMETVLSDG